MRTLFTLPFLLLIVGCDTEKKAPAPKITESGKTVMHGNNQFTTDLYAQLKTEKDGNLFFSPFSISSALTMTGAGARGNTAKEMDNVLHQSTQKESTHAGFAEVMANLNREGKAYELAIANSLWAQKGYPFKNDFLELLKKNYKAGLSEVDFVKATETARKTINQWVLDQTKDKIQDLFKKGVLNADTRLVLTNAIYFKGKWAHQFKEKATREQEFKLNALKTVKVPMMSQTEKFKYKDMGTFQILEMPYQGGELAMTVLLPKKVDGLPALEKEITAANLSKWLGELREQKVIVQIPRFKMTSEFSLKGTLEKMGMKEAFSRGANFTGMTGSDELYIQAVVHKAFVEVNEEGTEAAAATGVAIGLKSAAIHPRFRADHPFVFAIRDVKNDNVLFMGRVVNPKE